MCMLQYYMADNCIPLDFPLCQETKSFDQALNSREYFDHMEVLLCQVFFKHEPTCELLTCKPQGFKEGFSESHGHSWVALKFPLPHPGPGRWMAVPLRPQSPKRGSLQHHLQFKGLWIDRFNIRLATLIFVWILNDFDYASKEVPLRSTVYPSNTKGGRPNASRIATCMRVTFMLNGTKPKRGFLAFGMSGMVGIRSI